MTTTHQTRPPRGMPERVQQAQRTCPCLRRCYRYTNTPQPALLRRLFRSTPTGALTCTQDFTPVRHSIG